MILGLSYDRKIDVWSMGCIIAELHLGFPLFGGEDEHEQMCLLIEVLGLPPKDIIPVHLHIKVVRTQKDGMYFLTVIIIFDLMKRRPRPPLSLSPPHSSTPTKILSTLSSSVCSGN